MNNHDTPKRSNLFAMIALLCTLGITISGFMWLHIEPQTSDTANPKMSIEEQVQLLDTRMDQQQSTIQDLEEKIKHLEEKSLAN